ncbi:hypothetical protein [Halarcobacter sp.]|uniref:hypothetical protein n=1 Tax=Halarcobacter sp. TaxID=2321133 RepID=UPI002AA65752|nr:hypothetical protein [Halarcobacter sp.]
MYKVDHIMIESSNPKETVNALIEKMNLPIAWDLIETENYKSMGINFGDINFEFIDFKKRFGKENKSYKGFSGIAFRIDGEIEEALTTLQEQNLKYKIAEETKNYTTITIEEDNVFPTMFLVKYHFDINPWHLKLKEDFKSCNGGKFKIDKFISINLDKQEKVLDKFENVKIKEKNSSIVFSSNDYKSEPIILRELIENLEIVLL